MNSKEIMLFANKMYNACPIEYLDWINSKNDTFSQRLPKYLYLEKNIEDIIVLQKRITEIIKLESQHPTTSTGDKKKQALAELCELQERYPEKSRQSLLQKVEIKYDLTPKECEFLNRNFCD